MNGPEDASDTGLELDTGGEPAGGSDEGFDLDASMDAISKEMVGRNGSDEVSKDRPAANGAATATAVSTDQAAAVPLAPPKSWAADKHDIWKKLDRPAQEYFNLREKQMLDGLDQYKGDAGFAKQIREAVNPYLPMLRSMGVSEHEAVQRLMNAQYRLTNGTQEERRAAYDQIGREMGIIQAAAGEPENADPVVKGLQTKLERIESALSAESTARHQAALKQADDEVSVFAADKTNLYFDEVSQDMVGFINQGHDLKKAYEKAVWGNPVTRAKELARIQTEAAANRANGATTEKVDAAKRAASVNTRGTETQRAPTEHKGKFLSDESLKEDLRAIKARH